MKTIATINFKGGVGKSTVTWLLAKYVAEKLNKKVLVIDIDVQMCMTMAVQFEEDQSRINKRFQLWNSQHNKTLLDLLECYEKTKGDFFNCAISTLIFKVSDNMHLIPSSMDLYWIDFDLRDKAKMKSFFMAFLKQIEKSTTLNYDYIFFDCPPIFDALSYSVISNSNMVLMPVNPDMMASKDTIKLIEGLKQRIYPWTDPKIAVFLNKAKTLEGSYLSVESKKYLNEVKKAESVLAAEGIKIQVFDSFIPEKGDMKNAIRHETFPSDYELYFDRIWTNINREIEVN